MGRLRLGVRIRDFDLERVGFSLVILDRERQEDAHGYLKMTLDDLERLIAALRAEQAIDLVPLDPEDEQPAAAPPVQAEATEPETQAEVVSLPWLSRGGAAVGDDRAAGTTPIEEAPRRFLRKRRQPG